ncbi:unnamed protein product [Phytophthora lilii]|uniref:Unnamed protein product n=1 Tax=Phytophthora lilii TaxID=2077276 RepID=A0A9W6WM71_9STRA|nr:unnamed protein product [Phytophthora lilii]
MKIFGPDTVPAQPLAPRARGSRRARSSSSARTSQATVDLYSKDSDGQRLRRELKRQRRRSNENKVGNSALNPIALSSDSSDDDASAESTADAAISASSVEGEEEEEWMERDGQGEVDEEEDDEDEEEELSADSSSSSADDDTNDEIEEDELEIAASAKRSVRSFKGKSPIYAETQQDERRKNGQAKAEPAEKVTANAEVKSETERDSDEDENDKPGQNYRSTRPLLKTSHRKRFRAVMHTSKWPHQNQARSDSRKSRKGMSDLGNHHGKKRAAGSAASEHKPLGEKAKSARRHVLNNTDNIQEGAWDDDNDSSFDLGVEQYGESPPHRPPSRVYSRANSVMSSPATSVVAASPSPESSGNQTENPLPGTPDADESDKDESGAAVSTPHSFLSSSTSTSSTIRPCTKSSECADTSTRISAGNVNGTKTPRQISTSSVKDLDYSSQVSVSNVGGRSTSAQILMELTRVVLPPDRDNKYRIRVTVSADKPPVHTIWMENLSSHEQREYSFTDVCDLPGADKSARVPTSAVLTALFRCISSPPDAIVIVGPEPRATAESKNIFEKGEVLLKTSTAERNSGDANGDGDTLTLMVAYPALDLFRIDHNFPMKLVLANQQMQHLVKEVECLRGQLLLVQNDRDRVCEQLRQQEEENERIISRQVEVEVKARMADQQQQQSEEDIKQRMAGLVKKQIQTLMQTQEREKRDRDRARRWLFARSDWMTAFEPCRALTATIRK